MNTIQRLANRFMGSTAVQAVTTTVTRAFEIGQRGRRLASLPSNSVALNTLISKYGRTAVARSRYLCVNNPYAAAAKETFVAAIVGPTGIRPSTLGEAPEVKSKVHEDWAHWVEMCDADGITNLAGQQGVAASELFEAGEVFVQFIPTTNAESDEVPLRLRLIPSEMLPYENFSTEKLGATDNYIQLGIEFNKAGERVAYHFLANNPTDITRVNGTEYKRVRVPAEDVMHVYRPLRAGQVRGIPQTLSALVASAMLDLYDDAELERKRVAALFGAFVTKQTPEQSDSPLGQVVPVPGQLPQTATTSEGFKLTPGLVVDLLPGEDVKFAEPADVGANFETFEYRTLCRMAAGFGVPYASMSGDLKAANYGSIRAGLVQFRRRVEMMQYQNFIPMFLRRVWLRWLLVYTQRGLSPWTATEWLKDRRKHERVKWLCPRWEWVDPLKDMQAEKLAVDNGFKARHDTVEEIGDDPDETDARIKESQDSAERLGLELNTGAKPPEPETEAPAEGDAPTRKEKPDAQ